MSVFQLAHHAALERQVSGIGFFVVHFPGPPLFQRERHSYLDPEWIHACGSAPNNRHKRRRMLLEDPFDSLDRSHEHLCKLRVGCLPPQQEKTAAVLHDRPLRQGVVPDISVV